MGEQKQRRKMFDYQGRGINSRKREKKKSSGNKGMSADWAGKTAILKRRNGLHCLSRLRRIYIMAQKKGIASVSGLRRKKAIIFEAKI